MTNDSLFKLAIALALIGYGYGYHSLIGMAGCLLLGNALRDLKDLIWS